MKEINCNLCGKKDDEFLFEKNGYRIVKCRNCGLVYVNPQPEENEIEIFYQREYKERKYPSNRKIKAKLREARRLINSVERIVKGKNDLELLDIGCGFGYLLKAGMNRGWKVTGIEVAGWMVEYARRKFEVKAEVEKFPGTMFEPDSFEVITLLEVLEHLPDPTLGLKEIYKILKEDGYLIIRVPNVESFPARKDKINWRGFVLPDHLYFFSFDTLKKICEKCGFVYYRSILNPPWRDILKVVFKKNRKRRS